MPSKYPPPPTLYERIAAQGLLDQHRQDGKKGADGRVMTERKPLRVRKRQLARFCRVEMTKEREAGCDVPEEELVGAGQIAKEDLARAEAMEWKKKKKKKRVASNKSMSMKSTEGGIKLALGKRKRSDQGVKKVMSKVEALDQPIQDATIPVPRRSGRLHG